MIIREEVDVDLLRYSTETLFVPNRYEEAFVTALEAYTGIAPPAFEPRVGEYEYLGGKIVLANGRDIPALVASGDPSVAGLTGSEWTSEYELKTGVTLRKKYLGEPIGRVSLVGDLDDDCVLSEFEKLPVASQWPNFVGTIDGLACALTLSGGVEAVARSRGLRSVVQVFSGRTLNKNRQKELAVLSPIWVTLLRGGQQ